MNIVINIDILKRREGGRGSSILILLSDMPITFSLVLEYIISETRSSI